MVEGSIVDVPIHIRCTNRSLIDNRYPVDIGRWWEYETKEKGKPKSCTKKMGRRSRFIEAAVAYLREHPGAMAGEIAAAVGSKDPGANSVLDAMDDAVYEWVEKGRVRYALVDGYKLEEE